MPCWKCNDPNHKCPECPNKENIVGYPYAPNNLAKINQEQKNNFVSHAASGIVTQEQLISPRPWFSYLNFAGMQAVSHILQQLGYAVHEDYNDATVSYSRDAPENESGILFFRYGLSLDPQKYYVDNLYVTRHTRYPIYNGVVDYTIRVTCLGQALYLTFFKQEKMVINNQRVV